MLKKLVSVVITQDEPVTIEFPKGHTASYLMDPETGKYYRPVAGFEITGENLEDKFVEETYEGVKVNGKE
ncbi:MAG: hypothetical protein AB9897_01185 [Anaerolineaceae bacterium]